jgi:hypothetical protein
MSQRGLSHINLVGRGRATLEIDGMQLIIYPNVRLPVSYTDDVLNFNVVKGTLLQDSGLISRAGFTCDDIIFRGVSEPLWPDGQGKFPPPPAAPPPPAPPPDIPTPNLPPTTGEVGGQPRRQSAAALEPLLITIAVGGVSILFLLVLARLAYVLRCERSHGGERCRTTSEAESERRSMDARQAAPSPPLRGVVSAVFPGCFWSTA